MIVVHVEKAGADHVGDSDAAERLNGRRGDPYRFSRNQLEFDALRLLCSMLDVDLSSSPRVCAGVA